jgi:CO dehydrogenase nickel-insertion accessory protein CooC1
VRKELSSGRRAALTQAITGLGGIGKTQLAVQYAHRFFADYDVVWWLNAESEMILRAELAALAVPLELPEKDQSDQDRSDVQDNSLSYSACVPIQNHTMPSGFSTASAR